ncbi:hypothetical protein MPTK2_1g20850 [Marchantia polymorpha subsp. ruderalis]
MAVQSGGPYSSFYEKLQLPHPLVQRFAVNAIFQRLKSGPAHSNLNSPIGQEAFSRCLNSTQPAVIDQTVKEICSLCREGKISVERGLQELQSALESVNAESVGGMVNGIGFLCRLYIQNVEERTNFLGKTGDLLGVGYHPLVKSFQTRPEVHQHILQQVNIILVQAFPKRQLITLQFLQPFTSFVLLQSLTSASNILLARDLHSQLSSMTLTCKDHGRLLLKMLLSYIQLYPMETAQDCEVALAACKELVSVLENYAKRTEASQNKDLEDLGLQLLSMLVGSCHALLSRKFSFYHVLLLVRRLVKVLRRLSPGFTHAVEMHMVSLTHMLALVDSEQEQLLLLDLGLGWLEDFQAKGHLSGPCSSSTGTASLFWVFPALHVMSYPSVAVKSAAVKLLQALQKSAIDTRKMWNQPWFAGLDYKGDLSWGEQHLSVVVCRLVQAMWLEERISGKWFSNLTGIIKPLSSDAEEWFTCLGVYLKSATQRTVGINSTSHPLQENKGLLAALCTMVTVFLMHPNAKIALAATECLALIGKVEPIWGVSLLPVVLFCLRFRGNIQELNESNVQLGLLKAIPSLASHSATFPLVIQALQPMLTYNNDIAIQSTALRVLCKTWELTDRAFPYLQKMLRPEYLRQDDEQTELLYSQAACIRDVSEKDPDRGVDLVLSVQACIESTTPAVRSLGLQSLAFLCKEDVIDFYTAWLVISKLFHTVPSEPIVLESLCMLLRYGALDAAAHPEVAVDVMQILWNAATAQENLRMEDPYLKARSSALKGILSYELDDLETVCPDKRWNQVKLLFSETSTEVLPLCEELVGKVLLFEHRERFRAQREAKVVTSKLGKLLKALPAALNSAAAYNTSRKLVNYISEFPGAALLCLALPAPEKTLSQTKREFQKAVNIWQATHEKVFMETAEHLQLNSNLIVAVLALQSWCSFVSRWLYMMNAVYEAESPSLGSEENLLKAAKYLVKIFRTSCEEGIPRVAESATLALAALCKVLPALSHGIAQEISVFLESRLLQDGHEHMQWSATLALGIVATCLHATDWKRKSEVIQILLKYAGASDRGIVRGACGLALGFICQGLLRGENGSKSLAGLAGVSRQREMEALVQIVLSLVQLTSETCPLAEPSLSNFLGLLRSEVIAKERLTKTFTPEEGPKLEEDDFWAVVGLVWGLGSSVTGLEQLCCPLLVSSLTEVIISWISICATEKSEEMGSIQGLEQRNVSKSFLAAGACLALPTCLNVSSRLEILTEKVDSILQKIQSLIQVATKPENSAILESWPSPLFAALYIGAGNAFATCLQDGSHSLRLESLESLVSCLQEGVKEPKFGSLAQLGATIGISNVLGGGVALLKARSNRMQDSHFPSKLQVGGAHQLMISRPLLHEASCEDYVSSVIKNLLDISKHEQDSRLRSHAGWALAFTHNSFNGGYENQASQSSISNELSSQSAYHMRSLQDFPEDSTLRQICSKLIDYNPANVSVSMSVLPQTVVSLLRCLQKAPRLPALDWGALVRRLFRQSLLQHTAGEEECAESERSKQSNIMETENGIRQHCILFAVAHAQQVPALARFLDELCELSRLSTLQPSLRNLLMRNLVQLQRIFSDLRFKQLLGDVQEYLCNPSGIGGSLLENVEDNDVQSTSFRVNVWQGLTSFFSNSSLEESGKADEVISCLEECMIVLINLLPTLSWTSKKSSISKEAVDEEWSVAVACLGKTRKTWLLHALEVHISNQLEPQQVSDSTMKAVFARCQLVAAGCLSIADLKSCRTLITNQRPSALLVEVSWAAKRTTLEEKREWLLDVLATAFVSPFPTTALILMALLASCWSTDALLLPLDPTWAIVDLPLTLPSLLSQPGWASTLEAFVYRFPELLDRLISMLDRNELESTYFVHETLSPSLLLSVLRRTCAGLKNYLPIETKLKLANLNITGMLKD